MKQGSKKVTIQSVAKTAGVSVSTVSRVLNSKTDVAAETVEKVQTVIQDLRQIDDEERKSVDHRGCAGDFPGSLQYFQPTVHRGPLLF